MYSRVNNHIHSEITCVVRATQQVLVTNWRDALMSKMGSISQKILAKLLMGCYHNTSTIQTKRRYSTDMNDGHRKPHASMVSDL